MVNPEAGTALFAQGSESDPENTGRTWRILGTAECHRRGFAHESSSGASSTLIVVPCCGALWIVRTAPISRVCSRSPARP